MFAANNKLHSRTRMPETVKTTPKVKFSL